MVTESSTGPRKQFREMTVAHGGGQSLCVRIDLSHSSRPPSSRLSHRKTVGPCFLPQNFVVPLPALGKKGGAVTADSPCSCTAECRDCRARSSLHVGDRYPIVSRRSCSSTSARMKSFSSLMLLSLPCRRWLYMLLMIVQLLSSSVLSKILFRMRG